MVTTWLKKRTIVRAKTAPFRTGFALTELLAPGLGARQAERLWFRLPAGRHRGAASGGEPFEVTVDGCIVRGRRWGTGPVVYLVHGWGGSAAQLVPYVEPLLVRGLRVVAFDAPSHGASDPGLSGPDQSHAVEFGRALDAVAAAHGPAHAVIAHSMGAMVAMTALKHGWLGTERLVFVAPMTELAVFLDQFGAALGFGPRVRRRLDEIARRRVGLPVEEFDLVHLASAVERPPLLVVHDRRDRETPYVESASLVRRWPGSRLLTTTGLGHRRLLKDPDVVRAVTRFVATADVDARLGASA